MTATNYLVLGLLLFGCGRGQFNNQNQLSFGGALIDGGQQQQNFDQSNAVADFQSQIFQQRPAAAIPTQSVGRVFRPSSVFGTTQSLRTLRRRNRANRAGRGSRPSRVTSARARNANSNTNSNSNSNSDSDSNSNSNLNSNSNSNSNANINSNLVSNLLSNRRRFPLGLFGIGRSDSPLAVASVTGRLAQGSRPANGRGLAPPSTQTAFMSRGDVEMNRMNKAQDLNSEDIQQREINGSTLQNPRIGTTIPPAISGLLKDFVARFLRMVGMYSRQQLNEITNEDM